MTHDEIQEIENQVLSALRQQADAGTQSRTDVVNMLTDTGLPEDVVRAVVWRLLANGELALTPQLDIVASSPRAGEHPDGNGHRAVDHLSEPTQESESSPNP